MPNLLVEIGTEELPVDALDVIYGELSAKAKKALYERGLGFKHISVEATPRRITLFIESLDPMQMDVTAMQIGPSYQKAYDSTGQPTSALVGFLKAHGATINQVKFEENIAIKSEGKEFVRKGKYVVLKTPVKGKSAEKILPSVLLEVFSNLNFPKFMRWENSGFRFPRPIRWIVCLLDRKVIPFHLADVASSRQSYGHRFLSPKSFTVTRADWADYRKRLKRAHVILGLKEREELIRNALRRRFHQKYFDEELVHTTAQLVEEPYFLQGVFSKTYLELPTEVLASCMKKNQKIFACYDSKNQPAGRFVAVLNSARRGLGGIRADYENVLESRLRDARYFYETDTKEPFEKKRPLLEQLVYLDKLGTMREKTERLEKLAEAFAALLGREDLKEDLRRAARLSKIDLMTALVYEFPDLQGIAGREYALESGEKEEVAQAVGAQYFPKNLAVDSKELPKQMTPLGAMLGIIDRLDLLVGAFGVGLEPSGSQDPFALRRAGGGLVKLIRAFRFHFSIVEAIEASAGLYGNSLTRSVKDLLPRLTSFLQERVTFEIQPKPGSRSWEILTAVFRSSFEDLADVYERFEILNRLWECEPEAFLRAGKVVERTANILKGIKAEANTVKPELLKEPLERELFRLLEERAGEIRDSLTRRDYEKATLLFGKVFYHPLHDFFDQVMVNTEDPAIRANRQALMKRINLLYTERLADLSLLSRLDRG